MIAPNLIEIHLGLAILGCLLAVYWSLTLAQDPASLRVPPALMLARRLCILGIATAMLIACRYGYEKNWEPWPPYIGMLVMVDLYLATSIAMAVARRKICARCPLLTDKLAARKPVAAKKAAA